MSEDEGGTGTEQEPEETAAGGEEGGSERKDWQKELADRLAAQKAKKEQADAEAKKEAEEVEAKKAAEAEKEEAEEEPAEEEEKKEHAKRDAGPSQWEKDLANEMEAGESLAVTENERGDLTTLRDAQRTWTGYLDTAGAAINTGATWLGESMEAITSFLAPVPAMLLVYVHPKQPIGIPLPVMYKPTTLSWSKKADWSQPIGGKGGDDDCSGKKRKTPFRNVPQATFKGGGPEELDLELFYDTTDTQLDVRFMTKPLQMLVYMVPLRNEPPLVRFSWGMMLSKLSYIEDLDLEYTMFRADGTPLRAEISMTLTEYDNGDLSRFPMNPTSYSEARKTWVVTEGQTLDWIAYQEYGSAMHWRHIAQVNNLSNPRDLRSGQILKLTPLP